MAHTHFIDWTRPLLSEAVVRLLGAADGTALDLSTHIVVLPGGRAMRRFEEVLVEGAMARGIHLIPPTITTIGQLPELLFEGDRPPATHAATTAAWAEAARRLPADRLGALYGRLPDDGSLAEWVRIGRQLHALHREVARGGLLFDAVVPRVHPSDRERWKVLAALQNDALDRLDGEGMVDPDRARLEALRRGDLGTDRPVWLIGVPEVPPVTASFLTALGDGLTVLVHAPEDRRDAFDALGRLEVDRWLEVRLEFDDDGICFVGGPEEQADQVVRLIAGSAAHEDGLRPEDVVIGVLEPDVVASLEERLAEVGLRSRDAAGQPLTTSAPYRLLTTSAALLGSRRWEAFAEWIRHPDVDRVRRRGTAGDGDPSAGTLSLARLDRWYAEHLPIRVELGLRDGDSRPPEAEVSVPVAIAALTGEVLAPLLGDPGRRRVPSWAEPILEFLAAVYGDLELDSSRTADRALVTALSQIGSELQQWRRLPDALAPTCTAAEAIQLILGAMRTAEIPHPPRRDAIDLLGWLELPLDDAPMAIVTGIHAGTLPDSVDGDPFLPNALRAELGLETNRSRRARAIYRLAEMQASRRLHLVAGRTSSEGEPLRPSPLLLDAPEARDTARRVIEFYEGTGAPGALASAPDRTSPAHAASDPPGSQRPVSGKTADPGPTTTKQSSGFRAPPESILYFDPPKSLRATDFGRILSDPYAFVLERMEGCQELHDRDRELDGAGFGTLAHEVLEAFGQSEVRNAGDADAIRTALDGFLDDTVRRRFGGDARFAHVPVRLQVEQLRARLHRFADWQAARAAEGWEVRGVEVGTPEGGIPMDVDGTPMGIRAKIDRIDHHPEQGCWVVWDYKTSDGGGDPEKAHRKGRGDDKVWTSLQLPLYRWLASRIVDASGRPMIPGEAKVGVGYILLPRDLDAVCGALANWEELDFDDAIEIAKEQIRKIRQGQVSYDPAQRSRWATPAMDALVGHSQLSTLQDDEEGGE